MNKEENRLPHQLLFDCEYLLQEIREKCPKGLEVVEQSLKDILKYYSSGENINCPYKPVRLIYKGKAKPQPYIENELEEIIAKEYVVYD